MTKKKILTSEKSQLKESTSSPISSFKTELRITLKKLATFLLIDSGSFSFMIYQ
jgi:hypothetical protein